MRSSSIDFPLCTCLCVSVCVCVCVHPSTPWNCSITARGPSSLTSCAHTRVSVCPCSCPTWRFQRDSFRRAEEPHDLGMLTNGSEALRWESMHWFPEIIPMTLACAHASAVTLSADSLIWLKRTIDLYEGGTSHNQVTRRHTWKHTNRCADRVFTGHLLMCRCLQ